MVKRFDVFLVALDPIRGSENAKTRPAVVVSPDALHTNLSIVIVAPMTTKTKDYPTRVAIQFNDTAGQVALEQLRSVDQRRLLRRLGTLSEPEAREVCSVLVEMFTR